MNHINIIFQFLANSGNLDDEIIPMYTMKRTIISLAFEWIKNHRILLKDIRSPQPHIISKYDQRWLAYINENYTVCAFELINAANYLAIDKLIAMLSVFIAEKHSQRTFRSLMKAFFKRKNHCIPIDLAGKIFYEILYRNCLVPVCTHQKQLKIHYLAREEDFRINKPLLKKIFPNKYVPLNDFQYFHSLDVRGFLKIDFPPTETCKKLLDLFYYSNVQLNLDISTYIELIAKFLIPINDIDQCIIAGGIFSKYVPSLDISTCYSKLFNNLKGNQDIDVFMLDSNNDNFNSYLSKFKLLNMNPSEINHEGYEFSTFKVLIESKMVNFIFVHRDIMNGTNETILDHIEKFDFNLTKIFYSYKLKCLFMNKSLFSPFLTMNFIINQGFPQELPEDYTLFIGEFIAIKNKCESLKLKHKKNNLEKILEILNANQEEMIDVNMILTFLNKRYIRTLKYFFKGYFIEMPNTTDIEHDKIDESNNRYDIFNKLIHYFYAIFEKYILDKTEVNNNYLEVGNSLYNDRNLQLTTVISCLHKSI
jgi:hypothetical protein